MTSSDTDELKSFNECSKKKKLKSNPVEQAPTEIKLCIHFCEKKKRRCKFNALKGCDFCTWHDSFNLKVTLCLNQI